MINVMAMGSCLSLLATYRSGAEIYFNPLAMVRFCRIDVINKYFVDQKDHDPENFFLDIAVNDKEKACVKEQYKNVSLGASFESDTVIGEDMDEYIRNADVIVMDTFFDQRAKLISKSVDSVPIFMKIPEVINTGDYCVHPKLTAKEIAESYKSWCEYVQLLNPTCKVVILNFTSLDYLVDLEKRKKLGDIDKAMERIKAENLYYVCHQNLLYKDFDTEGGVRTLNNHLSLDLYQRYVTLIKDIVDGKMRHHFIDPDALTTYRNRINHRNVKIHREGLEIQKIGIGES